MDGLVTTIPLDLTFVPDLFPFLDPTSPNSQTWRIIGNHASSPVDSIVVQSLSQVLLIATPWTAALQTSLSFTISQSLLKFMSIESVMLSNHLILCHPLLFLPSIFPSISIFSSESVLCIRWPKYCSFSTSPSNEYPRWISFRIDWFDLLALDRKSVV